MQKRKRSKCDLIIRERTRSIMSMLMSIVTVKPQFSIRMPWALKEKGLKLPMTMKDMFDDLIIYSKNGYSKLSCLRIPACWTIVDSFGC